MKRLVFVLFVAMTPSPTHAWAQEIVVEFNQAQSYVELIKYFTKEAKLTVVYEDGYPRDVMLPPLGEMRGEWQRILAEASSRVGYQFDASEEGLLKIRRISGSGNSGSTPSTARGAAPGPDVPRDVELPRPTAPARPRQAPIYGDLGSWLTYIQQGTQDEKDAFRERRRRSGYDPCMYGDPGCPSYIHEARLPVVTAGVGIQLQARGAAYSHHPVTRGYFSWMKGCSNGPWAELKFKYKGGGSERHLWRIYINGEKIGSVDQGDSAWNEIRVCAEGNEIRIEKIGESRVHQDRYSFRPFELNEVEVGEFLFNDKRRVSVQP